MSHATTEALAWALIHFVWQGSAIAFAAGIATAGLGRMRPSARYAFLCGALALMLLAPIATFLLARHAPEVSQGSAVSLSAATPALADGASSAGTAVAARADWIARLVALWMCGVVVLALRALGGWALAQRMVRWKTAPAAEPFQSAALRLRLALGIRRSVRVLSSAMAGVPATVGWLRPVVLLPVSALTSLTPSQIELLLAHELAHVRRHDYLVNLLQTAVETVLFYHPAVWWVGGRIRAEREHCCDDLAVGAGGDALAYAETLATLESLRTERRALAIASDGGSLLARIQRLAGHDRSRVSAPPAWIGALAPAAFLVAALCPAAAPPAIAEPAGFLEGLADAGYVKIGVDDIIALKEHGVEPRFINGMLSAGLGTPDVQQLIQLREHGVESGFVAAVVQAGMVSDLDVRSVVRLRENGVEPEVLGRIRAIGFGPFVADDVITLRRNGVDASTFEALRAAGMPAAGVAEAVEFRRNGISVEQIDSMKRQGFGRLTLEQIVALRRGGVI